QVVIQFDLNRSIDSAAQDVQAAISTATKTLPQSMTIPPNYRKVNPADPPILILGARSETLPLTSINDYLDRFLAQQIAQVPGVNVIDTVDRIKSQLPRLTANIPPALTVETILDRTQTIRASVREVEFTLTLTIGLVILVILLFLRNVWATIIPSITMPLALL